MVQPCSVFGFKSNYTKKDTSSSVTVFKFPDPGCRKYAITNQGYKHSNMWIKHFQEHHIKRYKVVPCENGGPDFRVISTQYS